MDPGEYRNIVISGMGGSAIAGYILSELYSDFPIQVVSDYVIPDYADSNTLFIAISYSGNTEETLSTLAMAESRGCGIRTIASGGKLAASRHEGVVIPGGLQPRSALGYMLMPLINTFLDPGDDELHSISNIIGGIDEDNDGMLRLASEIQKNQMIPVIMGFSPYRWVSYRWKTQLNENSKVIAVSNYFPELDHNELIPYRFTYRRDEFKFIVLGDSGNERIRTRISLTEKLSGTSFAHVNPPGNTVLEKLFGLIHLGDYLSYHLASLRKIDPRDVSLLEQLKASLRAH